MFVLVGIDILPVGASVRPLQYGKKTSIGMSVPTENAAESISRPIFISGVDRIRPLRIKTVTGTGFDSHEITEFESDLIEEHLFNFIS